MTCTGSVQPIDLKGYQAAQVWSQLSGRASGGSGLQILQSPLSPEDPPQISHSLDLATTGSGSSWDAIVFMALLWEHGAEKVRPWMCHRRSLLSPEQLTLKERPIHCPGTWWQIPNHVKAHCWGSWAG